MTKPPFDRLPEALYRAAQVRELDRRAIHRWGIPGYVLMCRAAAFGFAELRRRWPETARLAVLCGGGNNGGDGYALARLAQAAGCAVEVLALSDPQDLTGDAARAWRDAAAAGVPVRPFSADRLARAELLVDALLGTGLDRPVSEPWAAAIAAVNAAAAPVLALDLPSGLHADSGRVLGAAIRAELTVSFVGLKPGLFTGQGPAHCGALRFSDLGVPVAVYAGQTPAAYLYQGDDLSGLLAPRPRDAHKGRHGHVLVIGGDHGTGGAAALAAEAAARCGAGLVSVATRAEHLAPLLARRPELMVRAVDRAAELRPLLGRASVIAIGPGLGQGSWGRQLLEAALASDLPLVVDADALNLLAAAPQNRTRHTWVLTPHPGEAARLLGASVSAAEVQADRFTTLAELNRRYGGVCVLKGAGSLIGTAGQPPAVCPAGNPGMASGGMGDVLSGVIAALLAQGLTPQQAARGGVFIHARAADLAAGDGERGLLAGDLFAALRRLVNP